MKQLFIFFKILCIVFISYSFCSCKTGKENSPILLQVDMSSVSTDPLEDKFTLQQIVSLDTTALLNPDKINYITFLNDQIFVSSYEEPDIYVFNEKTGKLKYRINRSGRGAAEYSTSPRIIMYTENNILIEDFAGAVNSYDLQGNYKNSTADMVVSNKLFAITNINDSTFLVSKELVGLYLHKDPLEPYYSVDMISGKGTILKKMVERETTLPKIPIKSYQNQFYKFRDQIYLCPLSENNIYHFDNKDSTLKCFYSFDINNANIHAAFDEQRLTPSAVFLKKAYILSIEAITNEYVLIMANRQKGESRYLLIDKQTQNLTVYNRSTDADMNLGRFIANDKGKVIQLVHYFDLIDKNGIIKNTPLVDKIRQHVKIYENMNPVLCIYQ